MSSHVRMVVNVRGRGLVPVMVPRAHARLASARFGAEPTDCRAVEADGRTPAEPCTGGWCGPFDLRSWHGIVEEWRAKAKVAPLTDAQKVELAQLDVAWSREPSWYHAAPVSVRASVDRAVSFAQAYACLARQISVPMPTAPPTTPTEPSTSPWSWPSIPLPSLPKLPTFPTFGLPEWWPIAAIAVVVLLLASGERRR